MAKDSPNNKDFIKKLLALIGVAGIVGNANITSAAINKINPPLMSEEAAASQMAQALDPSNLSYEQKLAYDAAVQSQVQSQTFYTEAAMYAPAPYTPPVVESVVQSVVNQVETVYTEAAMYAPAPFNPPVTDIVRPVDPGVIEMNKYAPPPILDIQKPEVTIMTEMNKYAPPPVLYPVIKEVPIIEEMVANPVVPAPEALTQPVVPMQEVMVKYAPPEASVMRQDITRYVRPKSTEQPKIEIIESDINKIIRRNDI